MADVDLAAITRDVFEQARAVTSRPGEGALSFGERAGLRVRRCRASSSGPIKPCRQRPSARPGSGGPRPGHPDGPSGSSRAGRGRQRPGDPRGAPTPHLWPLLPRRDGPHARRRACRVGTGYRARHRERSRWKRLSGQRCGWRGSLPGAATSCFAFHNQRPPLAWHVAPCASPRALSCQTWNLSPNSQRTWGELSASVPSVAPCPRGLYAHGRNTLWALISPGGKDYAVV